MGEDALFSLTTAAFNTALGYNALYYNTSGTGNTAAGFDALWNNTTGHFNTAQGTVALYNNTTGTQNTATGVNAIFGNTTGSYNTGTGNNTLYFSGIGNYNTATGVNAMVGAQLDPITGSNNTANGSSALLNITSGSNNIALGANAGQNVSFGSYNIDIGNAGVAGESGVIRIGTEEQQTATFIAGIKTSPLTAGSAVAVGITSTGQLGVRASSARYKEAIKPMDKASEAILSLHPVSFHYRKELDPKGDRQFGLVAEEVAKVDADLVVYDEKGKPFTVRYDEVNIMLLNEFIKEHRKVEEQGRKGQEQEATITELKTMVKQQQEDIRVLTTTLKEQASQIQKVSHQLELSITAPRVVANNQ
ncbi:MAG: tail fiber domain-containing protein [Verrucomicrobiota bacterium]|nr:tail fiber domain-containing protein [Verrucomicrobiota bacterium]